MKKIKATSKDRSPLTTAEQVMIPRSSLPKAEAWKENNRVSAAWH